MEQIEEFKRAVDTIKSLENQLEFCDTSIKTCDKLAIEAEKEIEEHFARYMNALAARKEILLRDITEKTNNQKRVFTDARRKLEESVEASKHTLQSSTLMYGVDKNTALIIWKGIINVNVPVVQEARIVIELQKGILETIQTHGKVVGGTFYAAEQTPGAPSSRFSIVEKVITFAGSTNKGSSDGDGIAASFQYPQGICLNPTDSCLYVCENGSTLVRKITLQGIVSTFAKLDGILGTPRAIAMNHKENTFFVTSKNQVIRISAKGEAKVFAGSIEGYMNGVEINARFKRPFGIAIDQKTGVMFVSDAGNHAIRKISPKGEVTTLAGNPECGLIDGNGKDARFNKPWGVCYDENSPSLLVCDNYNNKLRRVLPNGEVSTMCEVPRPACVAVTANNTIIVSSENNKLFKVIEKGNSYESSLLAGSGNEAIVDGRPDTASFFWPYGIVVHESSHSIFVADACGHVIRRVSFL